MEMQWKCMEMRRKEVARISHHTIQLQLSGQILRSCPSLHTAQSFLTTSGKGKLLQPMSKTVQSKQGVKIVQQKERLGYEHTPRCSISQFLAIWKCKTFDIINNIMIFYTANCSCTTTPTCDNYDGMQCNGM